MPDAHTPEQRSYNMSRIRSSGTLPERRLGELLRAMFPSSEIVERPTHIPGRPDWWLPELQLAIFADGCFFHKCPKHFIMPVNNYAYWEKKIDGNKRRDAKVNQELRSQGIIPVRVWEHNLRKDFTAVRRQLRRAARIRSGSIPNSSSDT